VQVGVLSGVAFSQKAKAFKVMEGTEEDSLAI